MLDANYLPFATALADISGSIIKTYYRKLETVDTKQDRTVVTIADREVEQALREKIQQTYPDHGIVGEEYGTNGLEGEYQWVIDPIDGTSSFVTGRPLFGTLIALVHGGRPVLGIIDQPITQDRWIGMAGDRTTLNGKTVRSSALSTLDKAMIATTSPELLHEAARTRFQALAGKVRSVVYGGDCYNYGLLAAGYVDAVVETGLKAHDFCALVPVIEAAGGVITDFSGQPLSVSSEGNIIAAANNALHEQVLRHMQGR